MDHTSSVAKQHYDQGKVRRIASVKEALAIQNREKEFPDLGEHNDEVRASRLKREADFKRMSLAAAEKVIVESKQNLSGKRYMQVLSNPSAADIPKKFCNNYSSPPELEAHSPRAGGHCQTADLKAGETIVCCVRPWKQDRPLCSEICPLLLSPA